MAVSADDVLRKKRTDVCNHDLVRSGAKEGAIMTTVTIGQASITRIEPAALAHSATRPRFSP